MSPSFDRQGRRNNSYSLRIMVKSSLTDTPEEPEAGAGAEEGGKVGVGAAAGEGAGLGAGTGIGDRRTDLRISTQVCRDFPPGKCRRGSDCHVARFFHPNAANHGDGGQSEDNLAERLSSRPECGQISTYTESEGRIYQIKG